MYVEHFSLNISHFKIGEEGARKKCDCSRELCLVLLGQRAIMVLWDYWYGGLVITDM